MKKIITNVFAIFFTKHDASSCNVELLCPYTFFVIKNQNYENIDAILVETKKGIFG